MPIVSYNPRKGYLSMQDTMNSLVNALFNNEGEAIFDEYSPRMDMKETEDGYIVKVTMPGLDPKDIDISVNDNVLTIKAEVKDEEETENETYLIKEHRACSYLRSVRIPSEVVADNAEADYKNGILTLTLPKAEEVKPKSIPVKFSE